MANGSCNTCASDGLSIVNSLCVVCDPTCEKCTGTEATQCTTCYYGTFFYPEKNQCLRSCPAGYWEEASSSSCQLCYNSTSSSSSFSCKTCSGGSNNECLSCNAGTFLYPNTGGQCLASCPEGYWEDDSTNTCSQCSDLDTDPSSCPGQTPSIATAILSPASSTLPAVLEMTMSVFKQTNTISGRMLNSFSLSVCD